ncbi:ribonuclease P protein component [Lutimaribacter marinistellae]|uniref:Ribonuclease P protein component n=1 Tax=Lutimaribacter marinistellae TaxID=1820329 RepID=A0ABV7TLB5_9RHOB
MTPPEAPAQGISLNRDMPSAVSSWPDILVLQKRTDFLRAARARRCGTSSMLVQARPRGPDEPVGTKAIRVGFTCSKKIGNAVTRNRAKRRLRAVARAVLPEVGRSGWDYVLIGKPGDTIARPYEVLVADFRRALVKLHGPDR